jgi:ribonucleoside-diphosphate reductase subunit M2
LEAFSFASPIKSSQKDTLPVIDDRKRSVSPDSEKAESLDLEDENEESLDELRKKFVGEVDLPES